ncbi:polyhydroxyalkanoate synthesis repressor PhaR [Pseudahrensia aquimaris]|uniref:Polyhydroxyalkanoate synthesis repressor PhaR n=1 Tax=Pseudahrensia aquimaris TaxID=744461 RepID=A0ABW3FJI5_9HYPH
MAKATKKSTRSEPAVAEGTILIKKYPNRRLYNTSTSAYIVLDDLVQLIRDDIPFVIHDTKTGDDITREILNQIIFEQETSQGNHHFPLELQKQLIAMYGDTYGAMVPDYLTQSMELFVSERARMSEAMGDVVGRNTRMMMEFSQNMARQNMELFKKSWDMFGALSGTGSKRRDKLDDTAPTKTSTADGSQRDEREAELEEIQNKIDALQNRLKSLS